MLLKSIPAKLLVGMDYQTTLFNILVLPATPSDEVDSFF